MEDFIVKVVLALVLGGIMGLEREYNDKPAGYATNSIICLGAALFTMLSLYMAEMGGDPGRIAAQIVSGVGFLGAGAILREGNKISGLTTAAAVWLVAAIGMAVGFGQYILASSACAAAILMQLGVRRTLGLLERLRRYDTIYLTCAPKWSVVDQICAEIEKRNVQILKKEVTKHDNRFVVALVATFTGREFQNITKDVLEMPDVYSLYK
ncbi:MAG TPA: MgtC/SapB family protein [Candidatus Avelusimicrobium excrementipullorum]|nr:MgtC/SapB family protein [Candidatus Avelusimicrobium excrementipullorum]